MQASSFRRSRLDTLDYSDGEPVLFLTQRAADPEAITAVYPAKRVSTRPPRPIIVDKGQLASLLCVLRKLPIDAPSHSRRLPRLSQLVRDDAATEQRRARHKTWLMRIAVVMVVEVLAFTAASPIARSVLHDRCVRAGVCAAVR
jgi:hypothetical protein